MSDMGEYAKWYVLYLIWFLFLPALALVFALAFTLGRLSA